MTVDVFNFEEGAAVWVSDPAVVWAAGKVVSSDADQLKILLQGSDDDADDLEQELVVPRKFPTEKARRQEGKKLLRRDPDFHGPGTLRFDDLTEVPELHEAAVLEALDGRFANGLIYTLTGPVLLAVNPFRTLHGLYSPERLKSFCSDEHPLRPHIFSLANQAFQGILRHGESQTVLVSGESGSGKTETTKFVMQFLALAGADAVTSEIGRPLSRVERQVLRSNPVLEAFGNAKTLRNDNSSRFGKYIELQFGREDASWSKRLVGARIRTYLLEKVRVVDQLSGERSFHIFYQVLGAQAQADCAGGSCPMSPQGSGSCSGSPVSDTVEDAHHRNVAILQEDLQPFEGLTAASFKYLRSTCPVTLQRGNDSEDFEETLASMRTVGFTGGEVRDVLRALAAVLYLGNIEFSPPKGNSEGSQLAMTSNNDSLGSVGELSSRDAATALCDFLGINLNVLEGALCFRTMQAPGERVIRMGNTLQQASDSRDALARHLYHALFNHIVEKTNESIGFKDDATFCGVLDIFGFEFFETNSFEQLCINFTNELLQQFFNLFIFENETALYRSEGISWDAQEFPDNGVIVELLQGAPNGIFPMLDEECFVIGGSASSWQTKLVRTHDKHPNFGIVRTNKDNFIVKHFAGQVTYTATGFLDKNRDRLSGDIVRCLSDSTWPFMQDLFGAEEQSRLSPRSSPRTPRTSSGIVPGASPVHSPPRRSMTASLTSVINTEPQMSPLASTGRFGPTFSLDMTALSTSASSKVRRAQRATVSVEFRQQLQALMSQIKTTTPHFVRCIKPNKLNVPFADPAADVPVPLFDRPSVSEQLAYQGVLEAVRVARAGYPVRYLHSDFLADFRALVKNPELSVTLRDARRQFLESADEDLEMPSFDCAPAVKLLLTSEEVSSLVGSEGIGARWTFGKHRVFLKQEPFAALKAQQSALRNSAVLTLQACQRALQARRTAMRRRAAVVRLQACVRGIKARRFVERLKKEAAVEVILSVLHTFAARKQLFQARRATIKIQAQVRRRSCQKTYKKSLMAVRRLQAFFRETKRRRRLLRLPQLVLLIQKWWRGFADRRKARQRKLAKLRLNRALRILLKARAKRQERLRWREETLQAYQKWYRHGPGVQGIFPTRDSQFQEYLALEKEEECMKGKVDRLQDQVQQLRDKVRRVKEGGILFHLGLA